MTLPIVVFFAAVLIPLLFGSPRTAPFWLGLQGLALAAASLGQHDDWSLHAGFTVAELGLLRGLIAPLILRAATTRARELPEHLLPSNLLAWSLAIAVAVFGFEFALSTTTLGAAFGVGTVAACVTLSMFLLATNDALPAQLFAVLILENGAALLETFQGEPWPPLLHGVLAVLYLLTVSVSGWIMAHAASEPAASTADASPEQAP